MNVFYVIPDLKKVSGGPKTRITSFGSVFLKKGDIVISGKGKFWKSIKIRKVDLTYIESATNRISFTDFFSLLYLRLRSENVVVFIRDIYVELFPEKYSSTREKITFVANKLSNFFLTYISTKMVFPTETMGKIFFEKNKTYPKRSYFALPPGCSENVKNRALPDFTQKIGILYLGSVSYANAGFKNYLNFADNYKDNYHFFVLSGDFNAKKKISGRAHINLDLISHSEISNFIAKNNIAVALHTRPCNNYDHITFPIKVLDFLSFQLPFFSERHKPLEELLGKEYDLFVTISDYKEINKRLEEILEKKNYLEKIYFLQKKAMLNTYEQRYKKLLQNKR